MPPLTDAPAGTAAAQGSTVATKPAWLFGRAIDSVFVANWWWPLLAIGFGLGGLFADGLRWWQLYLMSSPHRWITLPLVFGEGSKVREQWRRFAGVGLGLLAAGGLLLFLGLNAHTGIAALGLFMAVDYVWNTWHFASQGAGISRIYGRAIAPDLDRAKIEREKMLFRVFVIWVFLRLAIVIGATSGQTRIDIDLTGLDQLSRWGDFIVLGVGAVLLYRIARLSRPGQRAQISYAGSFIALYAVMLVSLHAHLDSVTAALAFAAAIFHASEYLTVCSWAAGRKRTGLWRRPAARSLTALVAFIVVIGLFNWIVAVWSLWAWATMTLFVSLLHYGYDGMIWRSSPKRKVALAST
jgi:hypothetical protein